MSATVATVFVIVYLGMILGGLPFLQLDGTGVALLGAIALVGLVGQVLNLHFADYLREAIVPVLLGLAASWAIIARQLRRDGGAYPGPAVTERRAEPGQELDPWQTAKGLAVAAALIAVFLFTSWPREVAALVGAGILMMSRRLHSNKMLGLVRLAAPRAHRRACYDSHPRHHGRLVRLARMTSLVVATAAFLATHFVTSTPLRPKLVATIGEWPYRGVYSLVALITLGWMIWAYAAAPREPLWTGLRTIPLILMPVAFVLLACGYWRNPTMVGADKLLKSEDPARGMIRITRHPIMWGIMLWAAAHMLARGDLKSLIFFGGFLVLAAVGTLLMDARKKSNPDWPRFAAATSHIPFAAIAQGRNRIVWREIGWVRPLIGLAIFFGVLIFHP